MTDPTAERFRSNILQLYKTIGAKPGKCNGCGKALWWVKTKNDKFSPFDENGLCHFADCPKKHHFKRS